MLGIISLSLPAIVERIGRGHALGFRTFQLSLPAWGALNDRELDTFFAETCGLFPDCQFHHYNLLRTKRLLTSVEYRRLAAAHPNLIGVKSSADDPAIVADLLTAAPRLRFYFTEFGHAIARRTHDVGLLASISTVNYARAKAYVAGDDARRAADMGIDAIMISNHGGRQLDGSRSPFDQLREIQDAVDGRIEIICDGGVRRGTHALKAVCAGATAASGGRLYLYALAAAGQDGVERAISILKDEIERGMKLMGVKSVAELTPDRLRWR